MSQRQRIAIVKYSRYGKCYPARCLRGDVQIGDQVVVLDSRGYLKDAEIVGIQHERWHCRDVVVGSASEDRWSFSPAIFCSVPLPQSALTHTALHLVHR